MVNGQRSRILMLTIDYTPQTGGVPRLLSSIVESTADHVDWRVITAAPGQPSDQVVRTNGVRGLPMATWKQRHWLKGGQGSRAIISAHMYLGGLAHGLGRITKTPVSSLAYGRELVANSSFQRLALRSLRHDHRTVTISSHSERLLHELGVPAQQTAWVGAELASLFPPAAMPSRREAAGLHLVSVSRLAEGYENFEVVLRAVAVLAQSGLVESYTIVGDGPRRAALGERIDHLGLQNVVHMPGRLDDTGLAKVLQAAHVGLFPSRDSVAEGGFEGFGIVVQELAAAGLPVIVGGVAGATDAARPEWATIVDPDNVREWVEAIAAHARDEPMRHQRAMLAYDFGTTLDTTRTARTYLTELLGEPLALGASSGAHGSTGAS